MIMERFKQHGDLSWCELMTSDVEGAKRFYAEALGWEMESMDAGGMVYNVVKTGGRGIGGIMAIPPQSGPRPPAWGVYITVDDVDGRVNKAEMLGAKVLMAPHDIPGVGRFAWIQDPQGAALALITYSMPAERAT
jgi:predicted enzyme related to lactoylglutathione lyase